MSHLSIPLPEITKSEVVYKGLFDLHYDELALPEGISRHYTSLLMPCDAAVTLAETDEGKLVINLEYRHPTRTWLLSAPGGRIDKGETPLETAKRELLEETGYSAKEFKLVGSVYPFPGLCNQKIYFALAYGASQVQAPKREPFELIQTTLKTLDELKQEIAQGSPVDGILCTALFYASNSSR